MEKSTSHCSLIEPLIQERIDKYLNKEKNNSETKENLNKLQKITDEVKFLTKQLQLSIEINKNNNSSTMILGRLFLSFFILLFSIQDERLLGEICYQLERRILILIFSPLKQFYGYSLRYLSLIIKNEPNQQYRLLYQKRFQQIQKYLLQVNFHFNIHSILTFSLINQYGIYFDYQWLETNSQLLTNLNEIKSFCYSICSSNYHHDFNIILHSLQLISNIDGKPLFYW